MSIEDIMSRLKKEYIENFSEKLQTIKESINERDKNNTITLFHQIKGSGETYGYPNFTKIAAKAEEELKKSIEWQSTASHYIFLLKEEYEEINKKAS